MSEAPDKLLTVGDVAALLIVPKRQVCKLAAENRISRIEVSGSVEPPGKRKP
jgi:hypothetical protein